ncbi:pyridoxamine 5'-phosphate oxidase family protein [Streptomyces sp. NPDC004726]
MSDTGQSGGGQHGPASERVRIRRRPARADYDPAAAYRVLDEALLCHVGVVIDDFPHVMPMLHVRLDDTLYFHGAPANRALGALASGAPASVTATVLDSLVMGRSAYENSVNYRSVMAFGRARPVVDEAAKRQVMTRLLTRLLPPGRLNEVRPLASRELSRTTVVGLVLTESSVKARTGPAADARGDLDARVWAGEVPFTPGLGAPVPDGLGPWTVSVPESLKGWAGPPNL